MTFLPKYVCWSHDLLPLVGMQIFFLCFQIYTLTNMGWFRVWLHLICFVQNFRSKNTAEVPWAKLWIQAFTVNFFPVFVKFSIWMCELVVYSAVRCSFLEAGNIAFQRMALAHFIHLGFFFNLFLISRAVLDFLRFGFSQCESEGYKVVSCSFIPSKLRCCFMLFIKAPIRSCSCRNLLFFKDIRLIPGSRFVGKSLRKW